MIRSENQEKWRRLVFALMFITVLSCFFYTQVITADAADKTANANTQVTIQYYTGFPSDFVKYADAYVDGDKNVGKYSYVTKSLGKIQWGEPDAAGNYSVFFDATDIHLLADYLNLAEEHYLTNHSAYLATKTQIDTIKDAKTTLTQSVATVTTKSETAAEAVK